MTREEKNEMIDVLAGQLSENNVVYLADVSEMTAESTSKLRRLCHSREVTLRVVKNTLLRKAMERVEGKDFSELYDILKGNTSIMMAEQANKPAKLIKDFRKKEERPILKGASIEGAAYIGDDQLDVLASLKSKEELIGDIVLLLQSPAKNVVSALQSGQSILGGLVKTLSDRSE